MARAIGGILPLAVGVALSPVPIIAVVLILTGRRARQSGPAFILGWLIGLAVIGTIVLVIAGPADASVSGHPAAWTSWVKIAIGVLLMLVAIYQFRGRPRAGTEPHLPRWVSVTDRVGPLAAFGLAACLAVINPKNLLLAFGAADTIAETGISGVQETIAYAVFGLIGTIGVAAPVVIYVAKGDDSQYLLARLKDWMGRYNAVIMSILCVIIALKLIGDAIAALA